MKKKKFIFIIVVLIVLVCLCFLFSLFQATPIIANDENTRIDRIQYNVNGILVDLEDYNEKAVIEYLSTCLMRRTIHDASSYLMSEVDLCIWTYSNGKAGQILLGKANYCSNGYGSPQFKILDADNVKAKLFEILGLEV